MRPGARGGWVNGSLTWSGLGLVARAERRLPRRSHRRSSASCTPATARAQDAVTYYYGYCAEKTLDLSDCGAQLWPLLDEAAPPRGDAHPHARRRSARCRSTRVRWLLDVTRDAGGGALVAAVLRVGDRRRSTASSRCCSSGATGTALVCSERADGRDPGTRSCGSSGLRARTAVAAAPGARPRALDDPGGRPRALRQRALPGAARRRDGRSRRTAPSRHRRSRHPTLVLHATYGDDHRVDVAWEWAYTVGSDAAPRPARGRRSGPAFRDLDAERAILARHPDRRHRPGAVRPASTTPGGPRPRPSTLTGLDSLRLTTEELPRLAALAGAHGRGDRRAGRLPRRRRVARDRRLDRRSSPASATGSTSA